MKLPEEMSSSAPWILGVPLAAQLQIARAPRYPHPARLEGERASAAMPPLPTGHQAEQGETGKHEGVGCWLGNNRGGGESCPVSD